MGSRFWWWSESDDACVFLAMLLLIPVAIFLCVITLPIWLPLMIVRGLYLLFSGRV